MKNKILAAVIAILALGQVARGASTFTVTNPTGSTFRITRTGNTAVSETIDWRVVSLSAIAGVHFTGYQGNYSGTVTFNAGDPYKDVTISESAPSGAYMYQNANRKYRFEVLDRNGDILASKDRTVTTGTTFTSSGAFSIKDVTIQTSEYTANDDGYDANGYKSVGASSYCTTGTQAYLGFLNAQLRMTLSFDAKENDDAYEYLQLLVDNTSTCDNRSGASNGDPGTPSLSRYMAGFEMDKGDMDATYRSYTFPVTSVVDGAGDTNPWGYGTDWPLSKQRFKSGCRATDGRIIIPTNFSTLVLRLNASGSSGSDEWAVKNVKAHIQAVDASAPTVLNNYKVSGGRHQKGNTFYVSVAFSEIVTVSGTPTLTTSWGTLNYYAGSGSNVLTFSGEISSDATGTLSVTGHSGSISDLAGNALSGTISKDFGTALDADYAWSVSDFTQLATNTYEIATKQDLRHLALMVNGNYNDCSGKTFRQTQDIVCDNTYIPIGCSTSSRDFVFKGTYDGQGHTVSGITVTRTGNDYADSYIGLFGFVGSGGIVKNVVLASSTFTGLFYIGGIVGYNSNGTIQNCRVESTVTINAGQTSANWLGGIVGYSASPNAKVIGCVSAATVSPNGKSSCQRFGGIVGQQGSGTVKNCLYTGTSVDAASYKGAIVGMKEYGTLTNNYYTSVSIGGVGSENSSSDQDGARRARTVTLGENIALVGAETTYDVSGITAIGTSALRTSDGTIYSGEGQTLTLNYTDDVPTGYFFKGFSVNGSPIDGNSFTMPASDVSVTVAVVPVITYIDADGNQQSIIDPTPIVSGTTTYGNEENDEGWYYVSGNVSISSSSVSFLDRAVHIILCDGAELTINSGARTGISLPAKAGYSLEILAQSGGSGRLTLSNTAGSALFADKESIDFNGGIIRISGMAYGIRAVSGTVTIRRGTVNIYGNVGIWCGSTILGVSSPQDFISVKSFDEGSVKIADGQTLTDGTSTYTGTLTADQKNAIAGKTLRMPFDPAEETVNLTARIGTLEGQTHYWATFYHPDWNYTLPDGATAFIIKDDKNLYRVRDGSIVPAGVAVVIMAESASLTLTATNANAPAAGGNILQGSASAVPVAGLSGTPYVLGKVGDVLGFYQYTGTSIPAGKAYYVVAP